MIRGWTAELRAEGLSASYVKALHDRLSQLFKDAVRDGIVGRNPCDGTAPGAGHQRPYCATPEQVWALHDAMPPRFRAAILLGAFARLRAGEACGLRAADMDFMRVVLHPAVQYGRAAEDRGVKGRHPHPAQHGAGTRRQHGAVPGRVAACP
jgi:integrase